MWAYAWYFISYCQDLRINTQQSSKRWKETIDEIVQLTIDDKEIKWATDDKAALVIFATQLKGYILHNLQTLLDTLQSNSLRSQDLYDIMIAAFFTCYVPYAIHFIHWILDNFMESTYIILYYMLLSYHIISYVSSRVSDAILRMKDEYSEQHTVNIL